MSLSVQFLGWILDSGWGYPYFIVTPEQRNGHSVVQPVTPSERPPRTTPCSGSIILGDRDDFQFSGYCQPIDDRSRKHKRIPAIARDARPFFGIHRGCLDMNSHGIHMVSSVESAA